MFMSLRQRILPIMSSSGGSSKIDDELSRTKNKVCELEVVTSNLRHLLDISRSREKKLSAIIEQSGLPIGVSLDLEEGGSYDSDYVISYAEAESRSFLSAILERGGWLIGLLVFQSCSSFILASNNSLLEAHPTIIYFLTMLVGAGGNAGNQAAVRVIRAIALGKVSERKAMHTFLFREFLMAFGLSALLGAAGLIRAILSGQTTFPESIAITLALTTIVFISIITGAILPFLLQIVSIDPAHSSTTIQVIMDIAGVMITCFIAKLVLHSHIGVIILSLFGKPLV